MRTTNPVYYREDIFKFAYSSFEETIWTLDPNNRDNEFLISSLFTAQLRRKENAVLSFDGVENIKGKILIADFDESVTDGASEVCSEGFIDVYDLPPIDTWFYLAKRPNGYRCIYAWVPEQFVELVERAIAVNCIDCLSWYVEETQF
ncbi:hypothetical protein [Mucilaginibacter antarcticus]|uniref:hypothetical protein n=1 Tax=Mucilaginibacter antarcticus TaxID=1855725 RepID=UPI00362EFA2E